MRFFLKLLSVIVMFCAVNYQKNAFAQDTFTVQGDIEFVKIPAGSFHFGLSRGQVTYLKEEYKQLPPYRKTDPSFSSEFLMNKIFDKYGLVSRNIKIEQPFYISSTLITVGQYRRFVEDSDHISANCTGAGGRGNTMSKDAWKKIAAYQKDDEPVLCVSWDDAVAYIDWLNKKNYNINGSKIHFDLPSEIQSEYAIRGAVDNIRWWGDKFMYGMVRCEKCENNKIYNKTSPVKSHPKNSFGLYDAIGNARIWSSDCWSDSFDLERARKITNTKCSYVTTKSAGWDFDIWQIYSSIRLPAIYYYGQIDLGIRLLANVEKNS